MMFRRAGGGDDEETNGTLDSIARGARSDDPRRIACQIIRDAYEVGNRPDVRVREFRIRSCIPIMDPH